MIPIFRWMLRLTTGLIVLGCMVLALLYWFAARSVPDYDATTTVTGISAPVEIVRDTSNVPHVFGADDADVFFGLGYAHAQDRMWQMLFLRRAAQGRLSELFGQKTVQADILMRRLDIYRAAQQSVADQDPETQTALRAYADGVNAWLNEVNQGAKGRGAPEMWLFNHPVAPWQPTDSIAVLKLIALQMTAHAEEEVLRARLSLYAGDDVRIDDLLPDAPGPAIAALPKYSALVPGAGRYVAAVEPPTSAMFPVKSRAFSGASNAWAAAPVRTANGSTLLANDPHLPLTAPSIWYLARLELETGGVIGGTIPGIPAILSGRSDALGWGVTTAYVDDQDVFLEEVNPSDASLYRTPTGWHPFVTRDSIIRVKDAPAITAKLKWTENGPVLGDKDFSLGTIRPPGHVAVLAWTGLSPNDTSMSAAIDLMKSRTIAQAVNAVQDYVAPAQNLTIADRNKIAMLTIGAIPQRDQNKQGKGRLPSYGYIDENRWDGFFASDTNPRIIDPEGGIVGNTNNKVTDRPFPNNVSFSYGDTQRIHRLKRLMEEREVHTRESFIGAQLDTVSFTARTLLPLVGKDLWFTGEAAENQPDTRRAVALRLLADWNGEMNEHLPEPLIYAAWMRALQNRLIRDELGPLAQEFSHIEPLFIERVFRNIEGAAVWCDVVQSTRVESCADMARLSLDDALLWLEQNFNTTVESLRWGDAHQATHDHPVLGEVPGLKWVTNIRQSTSGGDNTLMRGKTKGRDPHPFFNVHGAGYRGVYDFSDPESSVFIISTGQSGHPLSRHYDDLGALWRRGEYIQMSLDPVLARAAAVGITTLLPAPD